MAGKQQGPQFPNTPKGKILDVMCPRNSLTDSGSVIHDSGDGIPMIVDVIYMMLYICYTYNWCYTYDCGCYTAPNLQCSNC